MNALTHQEIADQIAQEERHLAAAPQAFFEAWKRGVEIAGPQWFGDGTPESLNHARSKRDLCPDLQRIRDALGVLSSGERMFLAALCSFYPKFLSYPVPGAVSKGVLAPVAASILPMM